MILPYLISTSPQSPPRAVINLVSNNLNPQFEGSLRYPLTWTANFKHCCIATSEIDLIGYSAMTTRLFTILTFLLVTTSATAETQRAPYQQNAGKAETTGFFSGLIAGGLAGGPPGAVVGAAIGALLGDGFQSKKNADHFQVALYETQLEFAALQEESSALRRRVQLAQQEITELKSAARIVPAALPLQSQDACCDNTVLSLHFRSGSSEIEAHYQEQLSSLVRLAKQMPAATVEITGYTDRNGDTDMNLRLSRERSTSIKQFFNRMGIQNSSITTLAYGETQPLTAEQNFEGDFFDRRVIVRLRDSSQQMFSQSRNSQ